jgi:clathrin heavy chain
MTVELGLECLDEMLKVNIRQNLQAVINIAKKYSDLLGPTKIIDLLEKYRTAEGLYFYLGGIVNITEDKDVTFKYIEAATRMGQMQEVERVVRESNGEMTCPNFQDRLGIAQANNLLNQPMILNA